MLALAADRIAESSAFPPGWHRAAYYRHRAVYYLGYPNYSESTVEWWRNNFRGSILRARGWGAKC
jgi:hypothetical protein